MRTTLERSVLLSHAIDEANLSSTSWTQDVLDTGIGRQLEKVSKLMSQRSMLGRQRDMFYISTCCWDTHGDKRERVQESLAAIDAAITQWKDEMDAQGLWNDVIFITASEFGRTMTSNGKGTDHA